MKKVFYFLSVLILAWALTYASGCVKLFFVSGRVADSLDNGIDSVLITFTGGFTGTTETDSEGNWSKEGLKGAVTVTPSKIGFSFSPKSRVVTTEQEDVDFEARTAIIEGIAAGYYHSLGLYGDGTVVAVGYDDWGQTDVDEWSSISAIAGGYYFSLGLKSDNTAIAANTSVANVGDEVGDWSDVEKITAGAFHSLGIKSDGSVIATGGNADGECDVNIPAWQSGVAAVAAGYSHSLALKSGGVMAIGSNTDGQCNVTGPEWQSDVVAIAAGWFHSVALKSNGTVIAVGSSAQGQLNVGSWTDIIAISAGHQHTVGLKSDGTVVGAGSNGEGQLNFSAWTDIIAIAAGGYHTLGLKADGTVLAVGNNVEGQCNTTGW